MLSQLYCYVFLLKDRLEGVENQKNSIIGKEMYEIFSKMFVIRIKIYLFANYDLKLKSF